MEAVYRQKMPPEVFFKKGVLKDFANFAGKQLCQSLFFNKVAGVSSRQLLPYRVLLKNSCCNFFSKCLKKQGVLFQQVDKVVNLKPPILIINDSANAVFFRVLWNSFKQLFFNPFPNYNLQLVSNISSIL